MQSETTIVQLAILMQVTIGVFSRFIYMPNTIYAFSHSDHLMERIMDSFKDAAIQLLCLWQWGNIAMFNMLPCLCFCFYPDETIYIYFIGLRSVVFYRVQMHALCRVLDVWVWFSQNQHFASFVQTWYRTVEKLVNIFS